MLFPLSPAARNDVSRLDRWLALIAFGVILVLRGLYAWHFRIDSDEPQHLHVVWGWTQGQLPYRDFFDNHTPVFQALCAPLFHVLGVRADIVAPMRLAMLPLFALTIWCVWRIAAEFFAPRTALWTAVLAALCPPFFLTSIEFRPDELWALAWLLELTILATGGLSPKRMFLAGLVLGFSFCVSMKSSLFVIALVLAWGAALVMRRGLRGGEERQDAAAIAGSWFFVLGSWLGGGEKRPDGRSTLGSMIAKCGAAVLAGAVILPAIVVLFFISHGAGKQMYYCVIEHNILPGGHGITAALRSGLHWLLWLPAVALGGVLIACRHQSADVRIRQVFVFFAAAFYWITLICFWPILTQEDYLPFYPAIMIFAGPAALWSGSCMLRARKLRETSLPAILAAVEIVVIVLMESPLVDQTVDKTGMIADTLRMTDPGDFVMDSKGETIYRQRPFYYVLEGLTKHRITRGLIVDDIAQRLIDTRAPLAVDRRMPKINAKEFIRANYVPIAYRLRTLGKVICEGRPGETTCRFDLAVPARYTLLSASGAAKGMLDGTPFDGPRALAAGPHEFIPARLSGRILVVWAQAVERGYSPFTPIKPDQTTDQD